MSPNKMHRIFWYGGTFFVLAFLLVVTIVTTAHGNNSIFTFPHVVASHMLRNPFSAHLAHGRSIPSSFSYQQIQGIGLFIYDTIRFATHVPSLFGFDKEKTYLIIFQNEHERRGTGGFITAYAVIRVHKGTIYIEKSNDIYALDATIPDVNRPPLPRPIDEYLDLVDHYYIRDTNISPDFPTFVNEFDTLYKQSPVYTAYDGIIAMDSHVLVDIVEAMHGVYANDKWYTATIDPRCDCPQILYEIWNRVGRRDGTVHLDRKSVLGELLRTIFRQSKQLTPTQYWGKLLRIGIDNLKKKHIMVFMHDDAIQQTLTRLNMTGELYKAHQDYLHINSVNFGGVKSNLFIEEKIQSQTFFSPNGITRSVDIMFTNPQEHSNCDMASNTLCLNAPLRNWFRIYVPQGSTLINTQGSVVPVIQYDEYGKTVFEGVNEVLPEGFSQVHIEYALPDSIAPETYSLFIQKQPGISKQTLETNINNTEWYQGPFAHDMFLNQ